VLLFDENLAARLAAGLTDLYPGCMHVGDRDLASSSDRAIWQHACDHGFIIATKDEDFQRFARYEYYCEGCALIALIISALRPSALIAMMRRRVRIAIARVAGKGQLRAL
jgi:predicted nuclease of predicted toxin-antitoxin system